MVRVFIFFVAFFAFETRCKPVESDLSNQYEKIDYFAPRQASGDFQVSGREQKPVFYPLSDPTCTQTLEKIQRPSFLTSVDQKIKTVSKNAFSYPGKDSPILTINIGYHHRTVYSQCTKKEGDTYLCKKRVGQLLSGGHPIPICKTSSYPKESLENMAFNSIYGVEALSEQINRINPAYLKDIPKIRILLQPKLETIIQVDGRTISTHQVDNAQWRHYPMDNYPYSILLYPHSQRFHQTNPLYLYFDQLAVIGHEYGHHIFEHLGRFFFHNEEIAASHSGIPQGFERNPSSSMVKGAVNEMIADYLAYFSLETKETSGKIYISPNQTLSRHLGEKQHENSEGKALSFSALEKFFSPFKDTRRSFQSPNYQDIHILGAALGHGLYGYTHSLKTAPPPWNREQMLDFGLKWITKSNLVAKKYRNTDHPTYFLEDLIEEWVQIGVSSQKTLPQQSCHTLEQYFPVFYPYWRIKRSFTCL
jgi:hypothetical protein